MSTPEYQPEQKSRFKITMNAKHEPQWELSVVAGETAEELDRIRLLAISQHEQLRAAKARYVERIAGERIVFSVTAYMGVDGAPVVVVDDRRAA